MICHLIGRVHKRIILIWERTELALADILYAIRNRCDKMVWYTICTIYSFISLLAIRLGEIVRFLFYSFVLESLICFYFLLLKKQLLNYNLYKNKQTNNINYYMYIEENWPVPVILHRLHRRNATETSESIHTQTKIHTHS